MFILHSSNKTENLLIHLTSVLENIPLTSPLDKEIFMIQSQGMERWLSQQLSSHFGLWANYQFLFPGKFFASMAQKIGGDSAVEIFDRELMLWRFELLLREQDQHNPDNPLHQYLNCDNNELKRFQLAQQLAQTFDQYQMMRPDMLNSWQQGKLFYNHPSEAWQCALWRKITDTAGHNHRGAVWQNIINKLNNSAEGAFSNHLPERLFIFGLNTLAPILLNYLQALSRHCDIHFFLLNPAQVYWADLANIKQWDNDPQGNPLLASLGQQGREFQQLLLEQASFSYEPDSYTPSEALNNLHRLQNDILNNEVKSRTLSKDNSISIHACHSRIREVEVLKDQLLHALEQDPELQLREIVVMAPDIQHYAPFISAVFNDIQHAIADRSLRLGNHSLDAFINFLKISQSRFGWQSVMDLLEQPVVYENFALSETDLDLIKQWVGDTHVRWGKSAKHKQQLGLPAFDSNTWQAALDRLLMGYAVGSEENFVDNILPYREIEGSSALILGKFNDYLQLLFKASEELKQARTLSEWGGRLYFYADLLLSSQSQNEQLERQQLNELLAEFSVFSDIHNQAVTLDVVVAWLESRLSESKSSNGFLRGQLTFCSMLPMRSIPFKVIALLGLNEGEFPKIDHHSTFDLIAQHFRLGDRSRRADDRYQFLEVLLSARQQLIITFIGQSIQTNDPVPPSVVVSEVVDILENYYQIPELITQHPLHAFSQRYFNSLEDLLSYSKTDFKTAQVLQISQNETNSWWQGELENESSGIIDVNDLFSFFRHPQQYFIQHKLGIRFSGMTANIEEREPFELDPLTAYSINQQWIEHQLHDLPFDIDKLQAQGLWVAGSSGELQFDKQQQEISLFTDAIKQLQLGLKQDDMAIDINVGSYRIMGNLQNIYQNGSLFYRYAKLKGKDFFLSWLHHLILNQLQPQTTYLISQDYNLLFKTTESQTHLLQYMIETYLQGQKKPDVFFTEATLNYVRQAYKLKTSKQAKTPALILTQNEFIKQMQFDPSLHQLFHHLDDFTFLFNEDFEQSCQQLILPVWEACHE